MDVNPSGQDPATGDDELAKVLAGVSDDPTTKAKPSDLTSAGLQFEETPAPGAKAADAPATAPALPDSSPSQLPPAPTLQEVTPPTTLSQPAPADPTPAASTGDPTLESIKKNALEELRPLIDKLTLSPEEKFDTILLIIRSTDDRSLIEAAHEAAKSIVDETKRAQALLDVIKEIDYFGSQA